jgi:hypothetical protein
MFLLPVLTFTFEFDILVLTFHGDFFLLFIGTVSNLVTYCVPMSFRLRHTHKNTATPWSKPSEWYQTSPNRPARPTLLELGQKTSMNSIEILWVPPNDNGAPINKYTLYGKKEMENDYTIYYEGTGTRCLIGNGNSKRGEGKEEEEEEEEEDTNLINMKVRPGETIMFYLVASNFIGDSVPSDPFTFQAKDSPTVSSSSNSRYSGETKMSATSTTTTRSEVENSIKCINQHLMIFKRLKKNTCDICNERIQALAYRCDECDYDICIACSGGGGGGGGGNTSERKTPTHVKAAGAIMKKWRIKAKQSAIRVERERSEERKDSTNNRQWEMPTQPTRICQLPNGWIECWDPNTEHCYYHDPRTNVTQWEHPCPHLVEETFDISNSDLFLSPFHTTTTTTTTTYTNDATAAENTSKRKRPKMPLANLPFRQKRFKYLWHIRGTPAIGGCQMIKLNINRKTLVRDSYHLLFNMNHDNMIKKFKIVYKHEVGIDSGKFFVTP